MSTTTSFGWKIAFRAQLAAISRDDLTRAGALLRAGRGCRGGRCAGVCVGVPTIRHSARGWVVVWTDIEIWMAGAVRTSGAAARQPDRSVIWQHDRHDPCRPRARFLSRSDRVAAVRYGGHEKLTATDHADRRPGRGRHGLHRAVQSLRPHDVRPRRAATAHSGRVARPPPADRAEPAEPRPARPPVRRGQPVRAIGRPIFGSRRPRTRTRPAPGRRPCPRRRRPPRRCCPRSSLER